MQVLRCKMIITSSNRSPTKSSCSREKRFQTLNITFLENFISRIRSARDLSGEFLCSCPVHANNFVYELFVLVAARSLTRSCFWTPTALLAVEDILNILLVKLISFDYESLYEIFWPNENFHFA